MWKKVLREWVFLIAIAYVISILINKFLIFTVFIPSGSMMPTINIGDRLVATRIHNYDNIKHGDILVFNFREEDSLYIKRVIGLPGDKIKIDGQAVYVNGEKLEEEYVKYPEDTYAEYIVPENNYFFLGDNRNDSKDSRYWNNPYIEEEEIKGKAIFRFYPFDSFGKVN
ncbi:signal peptidase I [Clostridium thermobutyricum]|uniref:signal peptidase I n=1 Tax=Clostridium thermobutyricum TaxID=29372 RepID=UPI003F521CDE